MLYHHFCIVTCENLMFLVFESNINIYLNSNLHDITMNIKKNSTKKTL
jgi:hypothetical protein